MQQQESTLQLTFLSSMTRDELKEFIGGIVKEAIAAIPSLKSLAAASQNPAEEPLVTVAEAARITGLAVNTLYDKTYQRAIPHYKKGKRVYFRVSELVAWIATGRVATSAEIEAKAVTHVLNNPVSPWGNRKGGKRK
jgi:excisionase family DNA binding protein